MPIKVFDVYQYYLEKPSCPECGTWECADCGYKSAKKNISHPGIHTCPKCKSTKGQMLDKHHTKFQVFQNHFEQWCRR